MSSEQPFNPLEFEPLEDYHLNTAFNDENFSRIHLKSATYTMLRRDISRILIPHSVSVIYGVFIVYTVLRNNYIFNVGSIYFVPVLSIHAAFEYLKSFFWKRSYTSLKNINQYASQFLLTHALAIAVCYVLAVLFGADFFDNIESTFVFSCILTTFVVVPLFFETGANCLLVLFSQQKPKRFTEKITLNVSYCVVAGAWMGAFVIPLDWNRPWQEWPIPCVIGALFGYIVGELISCGKIILVGLST